MHKASTYILTIITILLTLAMVEYPQKTFNAAIHGLELWWNVIFPSLLPFFILSEILIGIGAVHVFGIILEPLMRPLFRVPGVGAFAVSVGLASGYPMDAVITCNFRKNNLCSKIEAERLLAFTNTADPLFMFGAVAVGMFGAPEVGLTLAAAHYLSSLFVGLLFRFYGSEHDNSRHTKNSFSLSPRRLLEELCKARAKDGRSFGVLLGDSVKSSMNTIILIGGFIILFSVFLNLLSETPLNNVITFFFSQTLNLIGFSPDLAAAMRDGLFEIDIGAMTVSQANATMVEKVTIVSAIIAWSGLSVHGQVASIISEAQISMKPYMVARFLHATLAAILAYIFFTANIFTADLFSLPVSTANSNLLTEFFLLSHFEQSFIILLLLLSVLCSLSLLIHLMRSIYIIK